MKTSCCSTSSPRASHADSRPFTTALRLRLLVAANRLHRRFRPHRTPSASRHLTPHLS